MKGYNPIHHNVYGSLVLQYKDYSCYKGELWTMAIKLVTFKIDVKKQVIIIFNLDLGQLISAVFDSDKTAKRICALSKIRSIWASA